MKKICGNCLSCIKMYCGCECSLTDNAIDENQEACVDFIAEDSNYGEDDNN